MTLEAKKKSNLNFVNTYSELPKKFYEKKNPTPVKNPKLLKLNNNLCDFLNLDKNYFTKKSGLLLLSGNAIDKSSKPISMAYAGHQFGHFVEQLGDGRAVLLGEKKAKNGKFFDIQLKGSGKTAFSRNGDGRSPLDSVIREYLISEALHYLGIPTTRSLAIVSTGEFVERESMLPGGILTRVASSHIRIGTFEFFHYKKDMKSIKKLADYTINRHFPESVNKKNQYQYLLEQTIILQANLIAEWINVGFIHGVMNTDNTTISGETIDYGPCAFMNNYNPSTVYSYIDVNGRYAYGNQAQIIFWNLTKFSQTLSGIIDENEKRSNKLIISSLEKFPEIFNSAWKRKIRKKFGFTKLLNGDDKIILEFLEILLKQKVDYTSAFRKLSCSLENEIKKQDLFSLFSEKVAIKNWFSGWNNRMKKEKEKVNKIMVFLKKTNPSVIPRNHVVENVIKKVINNDDMNSFEELMDLLKNPYDDYDDKQHLITPPKENEDIKNTFCGT